MEFCDPCDNLKPDADQEPRCRARGSNRMIHFNLATVFKKCPDAVVGGILGVIKEGVFTPETKASPQPTEGPNEYLRALEKETGLTHEEQMEISPEELRAKVEAKKGPTKFTGPHLIDRD